MFSPPFLDRRDVSGIVKRKGFLKSKRCTAGQDLALRSSGSGHQSIWVVNQSIGGNVSSIDLCGRSSLLYTEGEARYPSVQYSTRLLHSHIDF